MRACLVVFAVICSAAPAAAGPYEYVVGLGGGEGLSSEIWWDAQTAHVVVDFRSFNGNYVPFSMTMEAVSQQFVSVQSDDPFSYSRTIYTGGTVKITLNDGATPLEGSFEAPILGDWVIVTNEVGDYPFVRTGLTDFFLGPGWLDEPLAKLWGVNPGPTDGGYFGGSLDTIDPAYDVLPADFSRNGDFTGNGLTILVPEPATLMTFLTGALGVLIRRRATSRRRSSNRPLAS